MSYKKGKLVIHCLCKEEEVKVPPDAFTGQSKSLLENHVAVRGAESRTKTYHLCLPLCLWSFFFFSYLPVGHKLKEYSACFQNCSSVKIKCISYWQVLESMIYKGDPAWYERRHLMDCRNVNMAFLMRF